VLVLLRFCKKEVWTSKATTLFLCLFLEPFFIHQIARLRRDTKMTLMQYDVPLQGTSMLTLARNVFLLVLSIVALYFMSELNEALGRQ